MWDAHSCGCKHEFNMVRLICSSSIDCSHINKQPHTTKQEKTSEDYVIMANLTTLTITTKSLPPNHTRGSTFKKPDHQSRVKTRKNKTRLNSSEGCLPWVVWSSWYPMFYGADVLREGRVRGGWRSWRWVERIVVMIFCWNIGDRSFKDSFHNFACCSFLQLGIYIMEYILIVQICSMWIRFSQ